ncbi:hypothetical protein L3N51_00453 [Metallosphaera sp. J1]|uniref:hypothetical protein n=1 Tax=Metallosphaera TaxID=41980 RepID=UPI001EE04257|nr:hypothetical protein [Metallosphaera javensis (ex Hofmann et al. 2022)]MCG3108172.1 hypothetical protein [Metallosphaera javensis (ex Hofmann et al. 2022)]BCS93975.1 MAG: MTHFR (MetF)-like [Metallosphaera javensis (ex Sakai et al. 2022)]
MEILAELHPKRKIDKLKKEISSLEAFDGFDIPDAPLGEPSVMPLAVGVLAREQLNEGKRIILNQRLADVNELFVRSLSITARLFNFDIAFTKGDKPKFGKEVDQVSTDRAIEISRSYGVKSGGMLSLRKSREEIFSRLDMPADFFLGLYFGGVSSLEGLPLEKIIPYVIIRTEKNREILKALPQPAFDAESVNTVIEELSGIGVKSVLLSSPGDPDSLQRMIKKI